MKRLAKNPSRAFSPAFLAAMPRVKATTKYHKAIGSPSLMPSRSTCLRLIVHISNIHSSLLPDETFY